MANPTLPAIDATKSTALQGTADTEYQSGVNYIDEGTTPVIDALTQQIWHLALRVGPWCGGQVIDKNPLDAGVSVGINACVYEVGGVKKSYAGQATLALTDDATNYIYLDGTSAVAAQVSVAAFPDDVFMLAEVVCASGDITSVEDARMRNFPVAVNENWSTFDATELVDMAGQALHDVKYVEVTAPTELTIAAGVITPTQGWHIVDTEADAASDDLVTITAAAGTRGRILCLQAANAARTVGIFSSGNIVLDPHYAEEYYLDDATKAIWLFQHSDTEWIEIARSDRYSGTHVFDPAAVLDINDGNLDNVGGFALSTSELTIAAGSVTQADSHHTIDTEADAASDDLTTIVQASSTILIIRPANTARSVVVKHGVGADLIKLAHGLDFTMDSTECVLGLVYDGTQWYEMFRAPIRPQDLRMASAYAQDAVPVLLGTFHYTGAFAAGVHDERIYVPFDCTFNRATGVVVTAPAGGACIVDVQLDTGGGLGSIFAADGERVNIANGTYTDVSATNKQQLLGEGDIIAVEVVATGGSPNAAEDLTVSIWANAPMQAGQ